jgi:uncharacterized delta-60 repeat protein
MAMLGVRGTRVSRACLLLGSVTAAVACSSILGDFGTTSAPIDRDASTSDAASDATDAAAIVHPGDASQDQTSDAALDASSLDTSSEADATGITHPGDASQDASQDQASDAPSTGFTFATLPRAFVHANGTTSVAITIQRATGFTAPVTVSVGGLPAGITSAPVVVTGTAGTIVLTGTGTVAIGTTFVATVDGSGGAATATITLDAIVSGASGSIDTTYPPAGAFAVGWGTIRGCFLQPDGKIVLVGMFTTSGRPPSLVVRLTVDGAIDPSFTPPTGSADAGGDIGLAGALQPDGNIVVASLTAGSTRISRYLTTGQYDSSFQGQGWLTSPTVTLADPGPAQPVMFVLQPNGYITIGMSGGSSVGLQRWRPDGTPDPSLGMAGAYGYTTATPNNQVVVGATAQSLVVGADNSLYIVGDGALASTFFSATYLMKLLPTTQPDTTYGSGGTVAIRTFYGAGPPEVFNGAVLYPHGAPGGTPSAGATYFGFDAFEADGGTSSTLVPAGVGVDPMATSTTIGGDPAGHILLAGGALALARFTPNRALDTSFAGQGGETASGLSGVAVCVTGTAEGATLVGMTDATRPVVRFWP